MSRSFTRKLAVIMRTRLCIQPVATSWRMPASTIGNPGPSLGPRLEALVVLAPGDPGHSRPAAPGREGLGARPVCGPTSLAMRAGERNADRPSVAVPTVSRTVLAAIVPNLRSADSSEVPSIAGRSRVSGYSSTRSSQRRSRFHAPCEPASWVGSPDGGKGSPLTATGRPGPASGQGASGLSIHRL